MDQIKTIWDRSPKTETIRLADTLANVANGFFATHGFLIVPLGFETDTRATVVLPETTPRLDPKILHKLANQTPPPKECIEYIEQVFADAYHEVDFSTHQHTFQTIAKQIGQILRVIIPHKVEKIKTINIHPTLYGTKSSFSRIDQSGNITIYLRLDQDAVAQLVFALVASLTRQDIFEYYKSSWSAAQAVADWLVCETQISEILEQIGQKHLPIVPKLTQGYTLAEIEISQEFCYKIGVDNSYGKFSIDQHKNIVLQDTPIFGLSKKQHDVMVAMIQKSKEPLHVHEIGDIIFGSEEKFSLYAVAKFIERLRSKLHQLGINPSHIKSVKGKGYMIT